MAKGKLFIISDNLSTYERVILCFSEFIGTAIVLMIGCMGCVTFGGAANHLMISLCFGFAVAVAIQCVAHISGAHINPAVTIASALLGNLPLIEVPVYFVGQFLGAFAGYAVLQATTPAQFAFYKTADNITAGVCSPALSNNITPFKGFLVEFFATLVLIFVCCSVWDPRNSTKHDSMPIKFGLTVAALAMAFGPYTGANINPARSLAPALWNGDMKNHWIYWLGPILAGVVGAGIYRFTFTIKNEVDSNQKVENNGEELPLNDKV